jgi:hypothetical protein
LDFQAGLHRLDVNATVGQVLGQQGISLEIIGGHEFASIQGRK